MNRCRSTVHGTRERLDDAVVLVLDDPDRGHARRRRATRIGFASHARGIAGSRAQLLDAATRRADGDDGDYRGPRDARGIAIATHWDDARERDDESDPHARVVSRKRDVVARRGRRS